MTAKAFAQNTVFKAQQIKSKIISIICLEQNMLSELQTKPLNFPEYHLFFTVPSTFANWNSNPNPEEGKLFENQLL